MDPIIPEQQNTLAPIDQEIDANKFQKIAGILCEKRRLLEEKVTLPASSSQQEDTQSLQELIEEMRTFGISEIDYQKHLVLQAKSDTH